MTDKEFDSKISGLMSSYEEPVEAGMWEGIESGLIRRRRFTLLRRVGYSVAAAAAVVAGVAILILPQSGPSASTPQVAVVQEADTEDNGVKDNIAAAEGKPASKDVASSKASAEVAAETESVSTEIPSTAQCDQEDATLTQVEAEDQEADQTQEVPNTYKTISEQIAENGYLAMSDDSRKGKNGLMVSASSNLYTANSSGNVFSSRPSYSAGGGSGANYGIVPIDKPHHYFPVSVALQLQFSFLDQKIGLGLGVNYTYLHSKYEALIDLKSQGDVAQDLHYIGVPINLYLNIIKTENLFFYANLGGMMEKGLCADYSITNLSGVKTTRNESISGLQWSANVGLGFEYRFIKAMGIYVDPKLTYFFDCSQPFSIRTEQPLQFNLEIGLRFHLF